MYALPNPHNEQTVEVPEEAVEVFIAALTAGFEVVNRKRGLPYDAVMLAAQHATGSLTQSYALFHWATTTPEGGLIAYQDTRDQTRYTRKGEYEPFHDGYVQTYADTMQRLTKGEKVTRRRANSVQTRVLYDIRKRGDVTLRFSPKAAYVVRGS